MACDPINLHPAPPLIFYTYNLQKKSNDRHYIGHTTDLKQRLTEHNAGKCSHISAGRPWTIQCYLAFNTLKLAQDFERYLKTGSGHSFKKRHFQ